MGELHKRCQAVLQAIADGLQGKRQESPLFQYVDPVDASSVVPPDSVDMVFSQAALEHAEDPSMSRA